MTHDDDRYIVVSSDCHAGPPSMEAFRDYVDPKHRTSFEDYLAAVAAWDTENPRRGRASMYDARGDRSNYPGSRDGYEGYWDADVRTRDLDADGIAAEVMFPQGAVPFAQYPAVPAGALPIDFEPDNDELRAVGARAYNRWLADICATNPDRHIGVAVLPMGDVDAAVAEAEWAREHGLRGVGLPAITRGGAQWLPTYNQPQYEPLWGACEHLGMPLNSHGGGGTPWFGGGPDLMALQLAETDMFGGRRALWQLIFGGVFERHPELTLVITEQRSHWVPSVLADLETIYESPVANIRDALSMRPSEYFARNCYIGASFFSRPECEMRRDIGLEQIMWGSDFPHAEGTWPWTHEAYQQTFGGIPPDERRLMLGENAIRCYGLDADALRVVADRIGPTDHEIDTPLDERPDGAWYSWAFREHGAWA